MWIAGRKPPPSVPTILFDWNGVGGVAQNTKLGENGDKKFKCRFCPKSYSKSQALGGHMNGHHEGVFSLVSSKSWESY